MEHSVCFIGHRKIKDTPELRDRLQGILLELIEKGVVNFIFGDHSEFNDLCYEMVTKPKQEYPAIKRINFRKDYEDTDDYTIQSGYNSFLEEQRNHRLCCPPLTIRQYDSVGTPRR